MEKSYKTFKADLMSQVGVTPCITDLARATKRSRDYIRETLYYVDRVKDGHKTRFLIDDAARALWERAKS